MHGGEAGEVRPSGVNHRDCDGCGTTQKATPVVHCLGAVYARCLFPDLWAHVVHERGRLAALVKQITVRGLYELPHEE